jgi:hypothetical protein
MGTSAQAKEGFGCPGRSDGNMSAARELRGALGKGGKYV